ncbi:MAG: hypothetical protein NZM29_03870 [Nitrospira sp.]|nr:hypothetical protein [Nitrospira sp.]
MCEKCGGLLIDEPAIDFYQSSSRRCINCGWSRVIGFPVRQPIRRRKGPLRLKTVAQSENKQENEAMKNMLVVEGPMKLVLCGCGKVHLTFGAVTLHLTKEEFLMFAKSVRRLTMVLGQSTFHRTQTMSQVSSGEVCH